MSAANELTSPGVTLTPEDLDGAYDVLDRLGKVGFKAYDGTDYDWHVLSAAKGVVVRAKMVAKCGSVPGE